MRFLFLIILLIICSTFVVIGTPVDEDDLEIIKLPAKKRKANSAESRPRKNRKSSPKMKDESMKRLGANSPQINVAGEKTANIVNLELCSMLLERKQLKESFECFHALVNVAENAAVAYFYLAYHHMFGWHVPINLTNAFVLFHNSFTLGYGKSIVPLGDIMIQLKQAQKAFRWFELGVKEQLVDAMFGMGMLLYRGGDNSQYPRKESDFIGDKVLPDLKSAKLYFEMAAAKGHSISYEMLGKIALSENPPKTKEAIEHFLSSKSPRAYLMLGHIYVDGSNGIQKNRLQALVYFSMAGNLGFSPAKPLTSQIWIDATAGDPRAYFEVGYCKDLGMFMEMNKGEAYLWYMKAANLGYLDGYAHAAYLYIGSDPVHAFALFTQGAEKGNLACQQGVAICYYKGLGISRNLALYQLYCQNYGIPMLEIDASELAEAWSQLELPSSLVSNPTVSNEAEADTKIQSVSESIAISLDSPRVLQETPAIPSKSPVLLFQKYAINIIDNDKQLVPEEGDVKREEFILDEWLNLNDGQ